MFLQLPNNYINRDDSLPTHITLIERNCQKSPSIQPTLLVGASESLTKDSVGFSRFWPAFLQERPLRLSSAQKMDEAKLPAENSGGDDPAGQLAPKDGQSGPTLDDVKEDPEALVEPDVNQNLLTQMLEMGFPKNRAVRSLHYSGAEVVEQAITWFTENEDDPDIDEPLLVKKKKPMSDQEMKDHLEALRLEAKAKREKEEKELELHKEKERVRAGKELMAAKRLEEESTRKRFIEEKKREKEEERQAREKIRIKLEEDRKARRVKLGLPEEPTEEELQKRREMEEKKALEKAAKAGMGVRNVAKPVGALERVRRRLVEMKKSADDSIFKEACGVLNKYLTNICRAPQEQKFRKIRLSNNTFVAKVASVDGSIEFLRACGFQEDDANEFLTLKDENVNLELINGASSTLISAVSNPFFGAL